MHAAGKVFVIAAFAVLAYVDPSISLAQEWTKANAGRDDYVKDRTDCAEQAQKMALIGDELQKDVATCLATKGWQRNQDDSLLNMYCEIKETIHACKRGATAEIYKKERAECVDYVMKTVGNKYSRPGWWGLGGLIASSMQADENKRNLERSQISAMKICLEGKNWTVELKGEMARKMAPDSQPDSPARDVTKQGTP